MQIFNFHGNPNGNLAGNQGDVGFDVDTTPNNYFVNNGGTLWIAFNASGAPSGAWSGLAPAPPLPPPFISPAIIPGCGFINPAPQQLIACGYDRNCYISTAKLIPQLYVTQDMVSTRLGGISKLIEACDDSQPPAGDINDANVKTVYNMVVQLATSEINGFLSTIYPLPLAKNGTFGIVQITSIANDGTGRVTGISVIEAGNYCVAPNADQFPVYMRRPDPLNCGGDLEESCGEPCGWNFGDCHFHTGTGLEIAVQYVLVPYSDESGQSLNASAISGVPVITDGGGNYNVGDLLVLIGGSSFVPAKVVMATVDLVCHALNKRRLAPEERNPFSAMAKQWRDLFIEIGDGEKTLDGTYKRFFSPVAMWGTKSTLQGANSL